MIIFSTTIIFTNCLRRSQTLTTLVFAESVQALFWDYNIPHLKCEHLGYHLDNLEDFVGLMARYSNTELYDFSLPKYFLTKENISLCHAGSKPPEAPIPPYVDHIPFDLIERMELELECFPCLNFLELAFADYFRQIEHHLVRLMGRAEHVTVGEYINKIRSLRDESH